MRGNRILSVTLLWLLVLLSAMLVIYSNHLCRKLYADMTLLEKQKNALQVEWGRYLLEQSTWASLARVEQMAAAKLQMHIPETEDIVMVME